MTHVMQLGVDQTPTAKMGYAIAFLVTLEMPTSDVAQSVHLTLIVPVIKHASVTSVKTHVRERVHRMPYVKCSITFQCVVASKEWKEMHSSTASPFKVKFNYNAPLNNL